MQSLTRLKTSQIENQCQIFFTRLFKFKTRLKVFRSKVHCNVCIRSHGVPTGPTAQAAGSIVPTDPTWCMSSTRSTNQTFTKCFLVVNQTHFVLQQSET